MTDNFALLSEPRRPWLDPDSLKQKFLALSTAVHPDRVHQAPETERAEASRRFAELNAAYNCLREPKERLRHLLELESGAKPVDIQSVPDELMASLFEVGQLCKQSDGFLVEYARIRSPILKAQSFERSQEWTDRLNVLRQKIDSRRNDLLLELKGMNTHWEAAETGGAARVQLPLARLDEIYRLLGYFTRWSQQLQERIVELSV